MKLVIAEKPSVAQSLAAVLGAKERGQGYLQGNGYIVSWCVGHLIGLAAADSYDAKYSKWCYEDLPIIPKQWKYSVAPDKKEQYEVLVSLMNRTDVESLVCATDAGREGELIFRLVYNHAGCKKPLNACGSAVWRIPLSVRAFSPCAPVRTMTGCMKLPFAEPRQIGW